MHPILIGSAVAGAAALGVAAARYAAKVRGPFEATTTLWSRGLALLCDHNGGVDFVKRQRGGRAPIRFDARAYANVRAGDLMWVRLTALPQFVREVLPTLRCPVGLVTGDEDWAIPSGFPDADAILASEHIVCWFTQNCDGTDPSGKISGIPIGLDFHTISNRRKWGHWPATPAEQEAELLQLVARMPPTRRRRLAVHADFHFNKHKRQIWGEARDDVETILRRNELVTFQDKKVRRIDLWKQKTELAFVVSPHGNGLDCHRTWESLVLGNIVIVKKSSLDPLYQGLPVVIVDDWQAITEGNLRRWLELHADAFARSDVQARLTNRHWIGQMRDALAAAMKGRS